MEALPPPSLSSWKSQSFVTSGGFLGNLRDIQEVLKMHLHVHHHHHHWEKVQLLLQSILGCGAPAPTFSSLTFVEEDSCLLSSWGRSVDLCKPGLNKKDFFLLKTNGPWPHSPWFFTSTPYWSNWTSNQFWKGLTSHICLNNVFDNDSSNSDDAYDNVYHHQGHLSDTKVATARAFAWPLLEDGNLNKYLLSEAQRVGLNLNLLNLVRISRLKRHWARWGTYFLADQITLFNGT